MPFTKGHKINIGRKCSKTTREKIGIANSKKLVTIDCDFCNKAFDVWPSKKDTKKFCSKSCYSLYLKEKTSWNKGLKGFMAGEKHWNWKGGVTSKNEKVRKSLEYKEWRKAVFERDDYTCQECNQRGRTLNADHIKPFALYPDLRLDINNGRTLCVSCHRKTDTWGVKFNSLKIEKTLC